jgi:cell division protein ZapA
MSEPRPVNVRVLDREYTVGVPGDEVEGLMSAARLLEARMREVRGSNRMAAMDRVAVLAALNLAHELQQARAAAETRERELARMVATIEARLDSLPDA